MTAAAVIRTPDQRLRVFVSSTLGELADERAAVRDAIERLRLVPVMFELGARPHPPRDLYRAYLEQSQVFLGIYWQRYGWIAPGEDVSGLEDEFRLGRHLPSLYYLKEPAPEREPRLRGLLDAIRDDDRASYRRFGTSEELAELVAQDLAVLLTERFEASLAASRTVATPGEGPAAPLVATAPPAPLGSLVGRRDEIAALTACLDGGTRLVTVTGAGGIGKTRLVLALAGALVDRYPDGVHVVPLAEVADEELVLPTLASRLGVRLTGTEDAGAALASHLGARRALLVLDNLEQVAGTAPALVALLERCPDVQILATSRRPLQVVGEQEWRLAPLAFEEPGAPLDVIAGSPAVELFVQRARAVDPSFALDGDNAGAVVELCRRLDGLPLAIELAAARVRLLPPAVLLRRLGARLDLLAGGADRPERHRTLRATIDWSTRLLSDDERSLFARLSVFAGGATLEAAEAVCDLEDRGDVVPRLAALLDHGLLLVDEDEGAEEPRVRMLETVRADAAARLEATGESQTLRRRHLAWFSELADRAQPYLCGPDQLRWLATIDPERANLRSAARTGLELGERATVLEMGWDLFVYYHLRGAYQEPEGWVAQAAADPSVLDLRQRAIATAAAGISALWRGERATARQQLEQALATFVGQGIVFETAVAELFLAGCELADGAWTDAITAATDASRRFSGIGHDWGVGSSYNVVGAAAAAAGDRAAARDALHRAVAAGRRIDNPTISAQALTMLAAVALETGELDDAHRHLREAVPLVVRSRDLAGVAPTLETLAGLALAAGEEAPAIEALAVAEATRERTGNLRPGAVRTRVDAGLGEPPDGHVRGAAGSSAAPDADPFTVLERVAAQVSPSDVA
jgi:predicted ATPase